MEYQKSGMLVAGLSIAVINYCGCSNRKTISLPNAWSENECIQNCFGSISSVYGRTLAKGCSFDDSVSWPGEIFALASSKPRYNPPMERIQKYLASQGVGSRRQIDSMLQQGRISVNGKTAKPGDQIDGREKIAIDGKLLRLQRHLARPKILL